jgi:hypothetical protein
MLVSLALWAARSSAIEATTQLGIPACCLLLLGGDEEGENWEDVSLSISSFECAAERDREAMRCSQGC